MGSIYRSKGSGGGSIYRQGGSSGASRPSGRPVQFPPDRDDEGGGVFGAISRIPGDFVRGAYQAAVGTPAGIYYSGEAAAKDTARAVEDTVRLLSGEDPRDRRPKFRLTKRTEPFSESRKIGKAIAESTVESIKHPLRDPFLTLLTLWGGAGAGAGGVSRLSAAAKAARGGRVEALLEKPVPQPRVFRVGGLEVEHVPSGAALTRGVQRAVDWRRHRAIEKRGPGSRAATGRFFGENVRAGRALEETLRAEEAIAKAPGAALNALGKKLSPGELYALRVVAEEAPLNERIRTVNERIAATTGAERRRHQKRRRLLGETARYITDPDGKPEFRPDQTKLQTVFDRMSKVAGSREKLGKQLGLLTEKSIQQRKTDAARAAMGARWSTPAHEAVRKINKIEERRDELRPKATVIPGQKTVKERPRTAAEATTRLAALDAALNPLIDQWAAEVRAADREARKGGEGAARERYEYWIDRYGKAEGSRIAGLPPEDRAAEGFIQGERRGYKKRKADDSRDIAEEMLSQVSGRAPTRELDTDTLLALHKTLTEQGVDMVKLKKALDERDDLRAKFQAAAPTPEEAFGAAPDAAALARIDKAIEDLKGKPESWDVTRGAHQLTAKAAREMSRLVAERQSVLRAGAAIPKREADFGTVREVETTPSRVIRGKVSEEAQRELDELALDRQAAEADIMFNQPRLMGKEEFQASPEAVYIPDVEQRPGGSGRLAALGTRGVIRRPRPPVRRGYKGEQKRRAREPLNTTRAVAEAGLAMAKFARLTGLREKLVLAASARPRQATDVAVRLDRLKNSQSLPRDVRQFIEDPDELALLEPEEMVGKFEALRRGLLVGDDAKIRQLSPEQFDEFEQLRREGKIGWVPKALLRDLAKPTPPLRATLGKVPTGVIDEINNASRIAILFLKPAYATPNILGNAALNVIQQGFAAPKNIGRAVRLHWEMGPENTAKMDTLMHEGFAAAIRGEGPGPLSGVSTWMANQWGRVVDKPFRRASFLHEAARSGYKTAEELDRLLNNELLHNQLIDVTKRANRQIIDYGRLSHREREIIRRVIFFYPWMKGSTVYAGNFLMEHPIQAGVYGQLGKEGAEESLERRGPVPSYLAGSFPIGTGLSNPAAAALFQTPAQALTIGAGLATGEVPEVGEVGEVLTPSLALALNLAAGENLRTGRRYPRNARGLADVAYDTLVTQTPQYRLGERLSGSSRARLFPPSRKSDLMQYLIGGLYPREYDPSRLRALARREQRELRGR